MILGHADRAGARAGLPGDRIARAIAGRAVLRTLRLRQPTATNSSNAKLSTSTCAWNWRRRSAASVAGPPPRPEVRIVPIESREQALAEDAGADRRRAREVYIYTRDLDPLLFDTEAALDALKRVAISGAWRRDPHPDPGPAAADPARSPPDRAGAAPDQRVRPAHADAGRRPAVPVGLRAQRHVRLLLPHARQPLRRRSRQPCARTPRAVAGVLQAGLGAFGSQRGTAPSSTCALGER